MTLNTSPFDFALTLDGPEALEAYLVDAFESSDSAVIAQALGVAARVRGMSSLADQTGLSRQALYKALSAEGNPEFSTVMKVAHALGFALKPTRLA